MQSIIVEKPYRFVPAHRGNWVPSLIQTFRLADLYLRRYEGIHSYEVRGAGHLRESVAQGDGILLAPNHCRYADPLALGWVSREVGVHLYAMASWHLYNQGWLQRWAIRLCGAFSVYREGLDRKSLDTAVQVIVDSERPLVVFPEGAVFRSNDILQPLLDGVAFIARTAARKREKLGRGRVVIHPVAIKYLLRGDVEEMVQPALEKLEQRLLIFNPHEDRPLLERISRLSEVMLSIKEIEHFGAARCSTMQADGSARPNSVEERQTQLVERLLTPPEIEWFGRRQEASLIPRIKQLRAKIVPQLTSDAMSDSRRREIWATLANIYVAQQIASHPSDYLETPTDSRVLETVERIEEDVEDQSKTVGPLHAILEVGEAIEVSPAKPPRGEVDPAMAALEENLQAMLRALSAEARPYPTVE